MEREPENAEDIERLLANARKALQEFEDGADWRRLLLRVRTASPAHPVLLGRFAFAGSAVLSFGGAILVMLVPMFNEDLARTLAAFDEVVPYVPEELPALPSMLVVLSLVMLLGWVFATWAAMSLGRDTTMLPWEQKQHQKLVNEVTRLTTQKAVMERIRATPAGARPRIATPVPVAARGRQPGASALSRRATPSGVGRSDEAPAYAVPTSTPGPTPGARGFGSLPSAPPASSGGFGAPSGGFGARPRLPSAPPAAEEPEVTPPTPAPAAPALAPAASASARPGGLLSRAKAQGGGAPARPPDPPPQPLDLGQQLDDLEEIPAVSGSLGYTPPRPSAPPAEEPDAGGIRLGGGVRLGARPAPAAPVDDFSDLVEVSPEAKPAAAAVPARPPAPAEPEEEEGDDDAGILGRARAGTNHLRSTPYGSAGRIRPPPLSGGASRGPAPRAPITTPPELEPARPPVSATRAGTPLGEAPRAGTSIRTLPPASDARGTPAGAGHAVRSALPGGMFGTPPPISRQASPPAAVGSRAVPGAEPKKDVEEVTVMEEEDELPTVTGATRPNPRTPPPSAPPPLQRPFPRFGPINEPWLGEAIEKAEKLQRAFPIQAHLEFSQEPHLPFTLVIARATPAMAVRAMVNFVEFLAQISTPPRARIELVNIPHLDRSFHKNVEAALEPYFQGNVEVEPNPGRVDILFTDPDPQWGNWSTLPVLETP